VLANEYATDLTDVAWALLAPLLPAARPGGQPRTTEIRSVINAIFYLLRTLSVAPSSPRISGMGYGVSLFPDVEELRRMDLPPTSDLRANSKESGSIRVSLGGDHGWAIG
jgi:putative transposase of IS4/5 family DUF4096